MKCSQCGESMECSFIPNVIEEDFITMAWICNCGNSEEVYYRKTEE